MSTDNISKKKIKFRNYIPQDCVTVENDTSNKRIREVENIDAEAKKKKEEPAEIEPPKGDILTIELEKNKTEELNIVPKKPNWDLKNQISKSLEKLQRRTQRAIVEILQEKLEDEQNTDSIDPSLLRVISKYYHMFIKEPFFLSSSLKKPSSRAGLKLQIFYSRKNFNRTSLYQEARQTKRRIAGSHRILGCWFKVCLHFKSTIGGILMLNSTGTNRQVSAVSVTVSSIQIKNSAERIRVETKRVVTVESVNVDDMI
eukprot:gene7124-14492_t